MEVPPKADQHYTLHGCHCLLEWQNNGKGMHGCSKTDDRDHAWCKVLPDCASHMGTAKDDPWDFCFLVSETNHLVTVHGCHCAPQFFYNGQKWEGCSRTSAGPTWCHIFEGGDLCEGALRTEHGGQHWDYCSVADQASPILTRDGCHCQPEWDLNGEHHQGCIESTPDRKFSWCYVFEDEARCPIAQKDESGRLWDACWILTEQDLAMLDTTVNSCHCEPEWEHDGAVMRGCATTPDFAKPWCYVIEDERLCKKVAGYGRGKERLERWDWCDNSDFKPDIVAKARPNSIPKIPQGQLPASQGRNSESESSQSSEDVQNAGSNGEEHDSLSKETNKAIWYLALALASFTGCVMYVCCCNSPTTLSGGRGRLWR